MSLKATGRKVGKTCKKQTSKNRKKQEVHVLSEAVHVLARRCRRVRATSVSPAASRSAARPSTLPAGSYVATAYPFSMQSQLGGPIAKTTFKVVARSQSS